MVQKFSKLIRKNLLLLSSTVFVAVLMLELSAFAASEKDLFQSCNGRSQTLTDLLVRTPEIAPQDGLFVARSAEVWIESKANPNLKIWARHNFKSGKKEILCASIPAGTEENISLPVLALLDKTQTQKTGDSVWQFQLMLREKKVGLWSQKSGLLSATTLTQSPKSSWYHQFAGSSLFLTQKDLGSYQAWILVDFDKAH